VPAAEKYAELEARGLGRPDCDCHGKAMSWNGGARWICTEKMRAHVAQYRAENRRKVLATQARWRARNPEKVRASNARQIKVGTDYFGRAETETEAGMVKQVLREKAAAFREQQRTEYKEKIDGWINTPVA